VAGLDPALTYLSEGAAELLAARISGDGDGLRLVLPQWLDGFDGSDPEGLNSALDRDAAIRMARRHGASKALWGSAVGSPDQLSFQVTLLDAEDGGEISRASASGKETELPQMVDRLAAELLARTAGIEEHRVARLTSASLPALRAYLAGRTAHRQGDYDRALREYGRALDHDSTFALAGMQVQRVSGWVGGAGPLAALGRAVARGNLDRLSERDRVALLGRLSLDRAGPVTARLQLEERESALRYWPDHPDLWLLRGEVSFHQGGALGLPDRWEHARGSFERALELDPGLAEAAHHLASTLFVLGDTAALRTFSSDQLARVPSGPIAEYLRWRAGSAFDDSSFSVPSLESMDTDATLYWIAIEAQDTGIALDDGRAAVQLRVQETGVQDERLERLLGALAYALNAGRPREATAILESLREFGSDSTFVPRLAVLTGLYADGDAAYAATAASVLGASAESGPVQELNQCISTLWHLHVAPDRVPRPRILSDQEAMSADGSPWAVPRRLCALVRDAEWLARTGGEEWMAAIGRLDRLLESGAILGLTHDGHREYAHLALARLHRRAGNPSAALQALARRGFYSGWQPYLASILREEASLAAATGEVARAVRALEHFLAFRPAPDADFQGEVQEVRATLAGLREKL